MWSLHNLLPSLGGPHQDASVTMSYSVIDRLHKGRSARVSVDEIAATVTYWLAELGATSPLVDDLVCALRCGDWPAAHELADHLSIDVAAA
jgi:hypothetical protein